VRRGSVRQAATGEERLEARIVAMGMEERLHLDGAEGSAIDGFFEATPATQYA